MHPTQPRPLSLALLSIMVLPALAGCPEQACTLLYAPDHVVVEFQADAFDAGEWQVEIAGTDYPARASLAPLYDPKMERVKA